MTPTVRKIMLRRRDGTHQVYWEVDLRYRSRGTRRRFKRQAAAKAYAEQFGQTAKQGRPVTAKPPVIERAVTEVLAGRRGSCAPATYTTPGPATRAPDAVPGEGRRSTW